MENPAPPPYQAQAPAQPTPPAGEWVYTEQYGWIWMPYGSAYTYLPPNGGAPDMYVYYPAVGWSWVIAPWLWGWGPMPYFGVFGPSRFVWWGSGFGRWYGFRGGYAGWYGRGYWRGGRWQGHRGAYPAPARGGYAPHGYAPRSSRAAPWRSSYAPPQRGGFATRAVHPAAPRGGPAGVAVPRGGFAGRGGSGGAGSFGHPGAGHGGVGHR